MPFVSVTRLRVRALRFLPAFFMRAIHTQRQVARSAGFQEGALLMDAKWTFWTLTLWDDQAAMRAYMTGGAHRAAMPKLIDWCDEASVAHWEQPERTLPAWPAVVDRMRHEGRPSKVRHPGPDHAAMTFAQPRGWSGTAIRPKRRLPR